MKKVLFISLAILISVIMIFSSCGEPEETTQPTATQPTSTQPTSTQPTSTQPTSTQPTSTQPTSTTPPITTTERPEPYGTITNVISDFGYEAMDPNVLGANVWIYTFYDTLLRTTEDLNFEGGVVDSWTISDDGTVWTFKVHEGIKFHNGDPLTAADIKFSVDRYGELTSGSAWSRYLSTTYNKVDSRVVDDYTFEYITEHPEATLLPAFSATCILPKDYFESVGAEEFFKHPIGSGPWKFVELVSKTSFKLEANTEYWRPDEIPYYQYYIELSVPEQSTRINMLRTGECDTATGIDYDRIPGLKDEGFATEVVGINGTDSLAFQGTFFPNAGPTGDIRIRQAMSYALNRQEIADTWYQGFAKPGGQFFEPTGVFGWTDELVADPYNPELAMDLLEEAGYPENFADPVIHIYGTAAGQDKLLLFIGYWEAVGLQIQLEVVDLTVYYSYLFHNFAGRIEEGDANVGWIFNWASYSYPNSVYHCANMYTSQGVHGTGNDPVADEMYAAVTNQKDYAIADEKFAEFQLYVKSLYINVGVVEYESLVIYNPDTLGTWSGRNWDAIYGALAGIQHP
jgi:ABC-type transport system substrate-binding protein